MRAMSRADISRGTERCAGSRMTLGPMVGSQSPVAQPARRPMWVIWHIRPVPCR